MKASNYNFFFPYESEKGKILAYNALTNALALMEEENYEKFTAYLQDGKQIDDNKLLEDLKKGCFLIEDDFDELQLIRHDLYRQRFSTNSLTLTIAPTNDCNFRCVYCYEKNARTTFRMTEDIEETIIDLVEKKAKYIDSLSIIWYGGEPLLCLDTIQRLSNKFIEICEQKEISYNAGMVSNAYLLTKDIFEKLNACKVGFIQVTVDGNKETHDSRRPLVGGQPTYEKIMSNLQALPDSEANITLRINVDRKNIANAEKVIEELKQRDLLGKVTPYLGKVDNIDGCYEASECLDLFSFYEYTDEFNRAVQKALGNLDTLIPAYPNRIFNQCGADGISSFVIGADGALYKCWDDIGKEELSFGNIKMPNQLTPNSRYLNFMTYDPTFDSECKVCKILPICMGGCPAKIQAANHRCAKYKNSIKQNLFLVAKHILETRLLSAPTP